MSLGQTFAFLFIGLQVSSAFAMPSGTSAHRELLEDWRVKAASHRPFHMTAGWGSSNTNLAMDVAKSADKANLTSITQWKDYATIQTYFEKARDERFVEEQGVNMPLRRSTWMYPDDGCFARAQLVESNFEKWGQGTTTKIFVFGDLEVASDNALGGTVGWWYHVAPIVSDGQKSYVIDPAIEPLRPLELNEWLARMGNTKRMTISICDSRSYTPYSDCNVPVATEAETAIDDQTYFLSSERRRIEDLGRDADRELGDFPPWLLNTPVTTDVTLAL